MADYNATLNLPKTDFAMRAALPKREPDMLQSWYDMDLYKKILEKNEGRPDFILHDGPPFSNGYIHMGTAMNKVLKDFILRYKNMTGYRAPYTPGWDNHGMPIESAIIKQNKLDRKKMSVPEFRNACKDFAGKYVDIQRGQFKRLGVLGDWDRPYLTMEPQFEAEEVKVFGKMFEKGYIYRGKKPVYWCAKDETALAEAEIEYQNDTVQSIYVRFAVTEDFGKLSAYAPLEKLYFVIWTTTTWTIPGNLAICLNADLDYVLAKTEAGDVYVLAEGLAQQVAKVAGLGELTVLATMKGSEFELMRAKHPLFDRESVVILGDHVTLDAGTGCVHTAPGHGMEDYAACRKYDSEGKTNIGILVPVDDRGYMTADAGKYEGLKCWDANKAIWEDLKACGALVASEDIVHQYPHCWRCKSPIIYRATNQWFCSVDAFKDEAVAACEDVTWMPDWGHDRMISMVRERADWCISRQRQWGLPIPVFFCADCGEPICNQDTINAVSKLFGEKGSNAWFEMDPNEIVPAGTACPKCGCTRVTRGSDTLDGWFDSGSTHIASLEKDDPSQWPADLYLEGADQYRGWFQSSLLTSVATRGRAPYKAVLTHGWTVDGEGKAMHKSLGNGVAPEEVISKYGADLLRLWAASADYRQDMRCSDAIFKQLSDMYLKIRNTARYILGNLNGFDPADALPYEELTELDQWALTRLDALTEKCRKAYDAYEFHVVMHAIHNFCVVDLSGFYLDILKDRLYCEKADSLAGRSGRTAIYRILDTLVRLIAPVLAFTANEIWQEMPHTEQDRPEHVMLNDIYDAQGLKLTPTQEQRWAKVLRLRSDVLKALEEARGERKIGKPLEAEVTVYANDAAAAELEEIKDMDLRTICIVSGFTVCRGEAEGYRGTEFEGITVVVKPSEAPKCIRCWTHDPAVGQNAAHPCLCPRCVRAVE